MDPKDQPQQPNPAEPTLPAKGTPDAQPADNDNGTNLPRPASSPAEPDADTDAPSHPDTPTDATAADTSLDTGGDADPSASNTGNDEPL